MKTFILIALWLSSSAFAEELRFDRLKSVEVKDKKGTGASFVVNFVGRNASLSISTATTPEFLVSHCVGLARDYLIRAASFESFEVNVDRPEVGSPILHGCKIIRAKGPI